MPKTLVKVPERLFYKTELDRYNVIILVSGTYKQLNKREKDRIKKWVANGNTLITTAKASSWVVKQKLVSEKLVSKKELFLHPTWKKSGIHSRTRISFTAMVSLIFYTSAMLTF